MLIRRLVQVSTLLLFLGGITCFVAYRAGYFDAPSTNNNLYDLSDSIEFLPAPSPKAGGIMYRRDAKRVWERMRFIKDKKIQLAFDSLDRDMKKWELIKQREYIAKWDKSMKGRFMEGPKSGLIFDRSDVLDAMSGVEHYRWDSIQIMHQLINFEYLKIGLWDSVQVMAYINEAKRLTQQEENDSIEYPDPLKRWETLEDAQYDSIDIMRYLEKLRETPLDSHLIKNRYDHYDDVERKQLDSIWLNLTRTRMSPVDYFGF